MSEAPPAPIVSKAKAIAIILAAMGAASPGIYSAITAARTDDVKKAQNHIAHATNVRERQELDLQAWVTANKRDIEQLGRLCATKADMLELLMRLQFQPRALRQARTGGRVGRYDVRHQNSAHKNHGRTQEQALG